MSPRRNLTEMMMAKVDFGNSITREREKNYFAEKRFKGQVEKTKLFFVKFKTFGETVFS